jgi:hypothetical protein
MSTLIVAVIVVVTIISIIAVLIHTNNKANRKKASCLLASFHQSGTQSSLSFSSQELLKNCIIGLDGIQRKLLVLQQDEKGNANTCIVDLAEVTKCTVHKVYRSIQVGDSKSRREDYLEKIVLQFNYNGLIPTFEVPFYKQEDNHLYEIAELEQKAKHWEAILTKLIIDPLRKRA